MTLFSSTDRILICAAHPDDEVLGVGGAIALARSIGADVRHAFFGEGVSARYNEDELETPIVRAEIETRNTSAINAARILGVPDDAVFFGDLGCCRFDQSPHINLVKNVEMHFDNFNPTMVFTHAANDTNIDHRELHKAVLTAARPIRYPAISNLLAFEVLSSTETNPTAPFAPDTFVDISATIEDKISAMEAYGIEAPPVPHPRSLNALRALAQFRGAQAGCVHAEAFSTIRRIAR